MPGNISQASLERAGKSIEAARVLHGASVEIASASAEATPQEVVIAYVRADTPFYGALVVPLAELRKSVLEIGPGSWSLIFSPGLTLEQVEARCLEMEQRAEFRKEAIERYLARGQ
ncbi:MAG: hypothetical protein M3014_01370 [Chloroflexota bacterium]|nr:hypothetical protein [Chloroflexota bacterium]